MKNFNGFEKQFIILSQAWYADANLTASERQRGIDSIMLGYYHPDGGTGGELAIRWKDLVAGKAPVPRIEAYDDSWSALATFQDVLVLLAELDDTQPTVEQVAEVLKRCGFVDATPRVSPYSEQKVS